MEWLASQQQTVAIPSSLDAVQWVERNFRVPETSDRLLHLAEYQSRALREATRLDAKGRFVYSVVVWSDIKKSIKSCIAAAVALWRAWSLRWGQVTIVANDLKQADSRVGFYLRRAIELNPLMRDCRIRNYRVDLPNKTYIEAVPIDPTGEAGGNADLVVFSELWGAHQTAQQRMWTEMTLPPAKFGHSQRWVETYAGHSGESPLLEQLYETGVKGGAQLWPDLEAYANEQARMFTLWNTTPRLDWQIPEYYSQEEAVLTPSEFSRVHRNQWVTSENVFVPPDWWDACRGEVPPLVKGESLVVGMDAGVSGDCFAVVAVSRRGEQLYPRYVRVWAPPRGGKINFDEPESEIRRLCKEHEVVEVAYDPYQLHQMASHLSRDSVTWMRAFSQQKDRLIADKQLYDLIRERRITHQGESVLREHVLNANAKVGEETDKLRIVKRAEHLKVDACVALSMACAEAMRLNL